ncbi:MAG: 2OG-Fe(II) oxygenase family protein [Pontixanthobacter sp.]
MPTELFAINPKLDRAALRAQFAADRRVQIRDVLTRETAEEIRMILGKATRWGVAAQAGETGEAKQVLADSLTNDTGKRNAQLYANEAYKAAAEGDYGFAFAQYSLVQAMQQNWDPDGPHQMLLEYLNAPDFLDLVRDVVGMPELVKADGQATLFAPQHFLGLHTDSHVAEGWRVAYVLNLGLDDWKPDWGGYLNFFDEDGDIVHGYRPRFNALNLFAVPSRHNVSYVPPFAPLGRFAITGWLRDR